MTDKSWLPVDMVMEKARGLPFPDNFYKAENIGGLENDALFISQQLARLTLHQRAKAAAAYSEAYTGLGSRWDCNTRLRKFCDRCEEASKGITKKFGS